MSRSRVDPLGMGLEVLDAGERARGHGGRQGVGEELRPGALGEVVADRGGPGHEPARRAAQRLAQRGGDDVDLAHQPEVLGGAAAVLAQHAGGVRVVHHQHRVVPPAQLEQVGQRRDRALHGEDAVGDHQSGPGGPGGRELGLEIGEVGVAVDRRLALGDRLGQPDARR